MEFLKCRICRNYLLNNYFISDKGAQQRKKKIQALIKKIYRKSFGLFLYFTKGIAIPEVGKKFRRTESL